jgi:hypothetical protein
MNLLRTFGGMHSWILNSIYLVDNCQILRLILAHMPWSTLVLLLGYFCVFVSV